MSSLSNYINELKTAEAFSRQSFVFDKEYKYNTIIQYKRNRVRKHVTSLLQPSSNMLELNAGTGEDALFFAQQGYFIHATDISEGMQQQLIKKISSTGFEKQVSAEVCSFNELNSLRKKGPYDAIFSNFGGLNCTDQLREVLLSFDPLLKQGGLVTLVIIPKFCLWETLLVFKGQFKTAFRRFFSSKGRKAHIEGVYFKCWYYNPPFIVKTLKDKYRVEKLEGLCTIVPPSYLEGFAEKHPKLYRYLMRYEDRLKSYWPWRSIGDYFIISLRKQG